MADVTEAAETMMAETTMAETTVAETMMSGTTMAEAAMAEATMAEVQEMGRKIETVAEAKPERFVTLKSVDGVVIPVSRKGALLSVTIKDLLEDLGDVATEVPVKVKIVHLRKVVEWMEHSKDMITEEDIKGMKDDERKLRDLDDWDHAFCDAFGGGDMAAHDDMMVDMILAANLLDMKLLLDMLCIDVASLVKGQSPEELRKVLERTSKPLPADLTEGLPGLRKTQADAAAAKDAAATKEVADSGEPANKDSPASKRKA